MFNAFKLMSFLSDNTAHIVRSRDRKSNTFPRPAQRFAEGRLGPVLRMVTSVAGHDERTSTTGPTPRRHIPTETTPARTSPSR